MDSFEWNKIAGAVLFALLVSFGLSIFSELIFETETPETPGYVIAVATEPEAAEGGAEAAASQPIGVLLASADPAAGEASAKKCATCHTFGQGEANKVGPNLWSVVERPIAGHEGYEYSAPMVAYAEQAKTWTFDNLNTYLLNPKGTVPGTKMAFAGLKNDPERANIIAYLRSLSDSPVPLPEATAAEAAPAVGEQVASADPAAPVTEGAPAAPAEPAATAEPAPAATAEAPAPTTPPAEAMAAPAEPVAPAPTEAATVEPAAPAPDAAAAPPAEAAPAEQTAVTGAPVAPATETAQAPAPAEPVAPTAEPRAATPVEPAESATPTAEAPAPAVPAAEPGPAEQQVAQQAPAADAAAPAAAAPAGDFAALVDAADPAKGQNVAKRCAVCHSFEKDGPNKVGPNQWNIVDRPIATVPGFAYSAAMQAFSEGGAKTWTIDELSAYIENPKAHIPGNKMAFPGLKKPEDRAAVIAYLRTLSDAPPQ